MRRKLKKQCTAVLKDQFGLNGFRPGQEAAANALLHGRDLLCILPTGAGKSLCWQLPAVMQDELTIVISPLIALMRDQVHHLCEHGIPAASINSLMSPQERDAVRHSVEAGEVKILFVAPERLIQPDFQQMCATSPPWLIVVDEAHCVVQWGKEFRPAYQDIATFIGQLPARPVICALTATADQNMQTSITNILEMRMPRRIELPYVRENLHYEVATCLNKYAAVLRTLPDAQGKTLIFCRTRSGTESLAEFLKKHGYASAFYHAGMDRAQRDAIQRLFMNGSVQVLTATTAFGMGVDIPDIRTMIHLDPPSDVIDYIQQTGRAGRDGQISHCLMLIEPIDFLHVNQWIQRGLNRQRHNPIRRWLELRKAWQPFASLMQVVMASRCIPQSAAASLGQQTRPCGVCSACKRGKLIRRVPRLHRMTDWRVRQWFLLWQRKAIARQKHCSPRAIASRHMLRTAAIRLTWPARKKPVPEDMERMLLYFQKWS